MKIKYYKNINSILKGLLGYIAYIIIFPSWLSPLLHKMRGVKINNIFEVYIAQGVIIDSLFPELVTIGEGVYLTRHVKIICHINYTKQIQQIINKENTTGKVIICNGAFIGVGSVNTPIFLQRINRKLAEPSLL